MAQLKTEETLHHYLRKHFKKISENVARQLPEHTVVLEQSVILHPHSPQVEHQTPLPIIDRERGK